MRRSGFTLLETLFTVLLVGVALGLSAGAFRSYSRASRFLNDKTPSLQALTAVLHTVRSELMEAVSLSSPASPSSPVATKLSLNKVDPNILDRLSMKVPDWTPYDRTDSAIANDFLVGVTYQLVNGQLTRAVKFASDSVYQPGSLVVDGVAAFGCEWREDQTVELRITVEESRGPRVYSSRTLRRVRP